MIVTVDKRKLRWLAKSRAGRLTEDEDRVASVYQVLVGSSSVAWQGGHMGRRLNGCLAMIFWLLTPPAQWVMEWLVRRRLTRRG